jgi:hypothetical protein
MNRVSSEGIGARGVAVGHNFLDMPKHRLPNATPVHLPNVVPVQRSGSSQDDSGNAETFSSSAADLVNG